MSDEVLLGIDHGGANVGLAFGRNGLVTPLIVIDAKNADSAISKILRTAIEYKITKIIIGLPLNEEGKETPQAKKIRRFGNTLKAKWKRPVEYVDEYGSSQESLERQSSLGSFGKAKKRVDNLSAAVILRNYYSEREK